MTFPGFPWPWEPCPIVLIHTHSKSPQLAHTHTHTTASQNLLLSGHVEIDVPVHKHFHYPFNNCGHISHHSLSSVLSHFKIMMHITETSNNTVKDFLFWHIGNHLLPVLLSSLCVTHAPVKQPLQDVTRDHKTLDRPNMIYKTWSKFRNQRFNTP